jgi:hypothetical protein
MFTNYNSMKYFGLAIPDPVLLLLLGCRSSLIGQVQAWR